MITLTDALSRYATSLEPLPTEQRRLDDALGRVLAADVAAATDLPMFTQSAVDGYAVVSADTVGSPVELTLIGDIPAGHPGGTSLATGTTARILTGGALPVGADAVARQEIVERRDNTIRVTQSIAVGADTRFRGEELKRGDIVANAGQRLDAGLTAALAMAGVTAAEVRRAPRVTVLITGDEVAPLGAALAPGQIYDANGPLVRAWFVERGYAAPLIRYVADQRERVARELDDALTHADLVITTGGVSVGDRDYLPELAPTLDVHKVFWQVAQKPGKPLWFGTRNGAALLGLPGNPAAVLVCLTVHVASALRALEGIAPLSPDWHIGILDTPAKADAKRDRLIRVAMRYDNGRVLLTLLPRQESHMLSNLGQAHALAWLPARERHYETGECVRWLALRG